MTKKSPRKKDVSMVKKNNEPQIRDINVIANEIRLEEEGRIFLKMYEQSYCVDNVIAALRERGYKDEVIATIMDLSSVRNKLSLYNSRSLDGERELITKEDRINEVREVYMYARRKALKDSKYWKGFSEIAKVYNILSETNEPIKEKMKIKKEIPFVDYAEEDGN